MLVLLPPSEGKSAPAQGSPLQLDRLSNPHLTDHRERVLAATTLAAAAPDAASVFGVSTKLLAEIERNQHLATNPAAPAHRVYTGVLFSALDYSSLPPAAQRQAADQTLIFSALFGTVSLTDPIPAYRLSGTVNLPQIGRVASSWRGLIDFPDHELLLDCRSTTYQSMWKPKRAVSVRVETSAGKVVTHFAKHARGLVARELALAVSRPKTLTDVVDVLSEAWRGSGPHPRIQNGMLVIVVD